MSNPKQIVDEIIGQNQISHRVLPKILTIGSLLPNTQSNSARNSTQKCHRWAENELLNDIKTLPKTALNQKYKLTYSRWKNMKSRKKIGAVIDPKFDSFSDFLLSMGPVPSKTYTLDRIDNNDPTYSPENCRWADKYTQNNNRGNNVYITHNGESRTIAQWASLTNQNPSTLYKRKKSGWSDDEIITGFRERLETDPWLITPWPIKNRLKWEKLYQTQENYEGGLSRLEFLVKTTTGYLKDLQRKAWEYERDEKSLPEKLAMDICYWETLNQKSSDLNRLKKNRATFIGRFGKDNPLEAKLYDLIHPETDLLDEIINLSADDVRQILRNQKESSE